ncbi:MAG: hypothetical protein ACTSPY_10260 [Candidatus Helarchaeota archaeon]
MYKIEELRGFNFELDKILQIFIELNIVNAILLYTKLNKRFSRNGLTENSLKYYKIKVKDAIAKVMRAFMYQ